MKSGRKFPSRYGLDRVNVANGVRLLIRKKPFT